MGDPSYEELLKRVIKFEKAEAKWKKVEEHLKERTEELSKMNRLLKKEMVDRTKAEEALMDSEIKYKNLVDNATVGVYRTSFKGDVLYANDALLKMSEYDSMEEINKAGLINLYKNPEDREKFLDKLRKTGKVDNFEIEYLTKSKKTLHVLLNATIDDKNLSGMIIDISKRKKVEEIQNVLYEISGAVVSDLSLDELYNSIHKSLSRIIDTTNFYIALYDKEKDLITFPYFKDEKDKEMKPMSASGSRSGTASVINSGETFFHTRRMYQDMLEKGKLKLYGTPSKVWLCAPLKIKGNVLGAITVQSYTDPNLYSEKDIPLMEFVAGHIAGVIEHKRAEEALKESEEKFRSFMETASDLMHIADKDGYFTYVNNSMAETLGYSKEEMTGMHVSRILSKVTLKETYKTNLKKLKTQGQISRETVWVTKDSKEIFGEVKVKAVYDSSGEYAGNRGLFRDITERKRLEEQLQIRQRMVSLGTLAGGIAHDFNNILAAIMGYLGMLNLESEGFSEIQKKYLDNAEKNCNRAADLIKQFQTLSEGAVTEKTNVDIYETANEVFSVLQETTDRLIEKTVQIKPGNFYVYAAPSELNQVFLNLGMNAVQAIEDKGVKQGDCIRISAVEQIIDERDKTGLPLGEYIHILFSDTGEGMSEEVRRRAFDPLYTTREKSAKKGQGLGLAMVYNIITSIHHGHIEIESEEGNGTTFHIYLPKAYPDESVREKEEVEIAGGHETILIVDDETTILDVARTILNKYGYNVITAVDGEKALDIYKEQKDSIDAVLLDLIMPKMPGKTVLKKMVEIDPRVKIIICSGQSESDVQKEVLSAAKGFVKKPYQLTHLAQAVRTALDQ